MTRTVGTPVFVGLLFAITFGIALGAHYAGQMWGVAAYVTAMLGSIAGLAAAAWWMRREPSCCWEEAGGAATGSMDGGA